MTTPTQNVPVFQPDNGFDLTWQHTQLAFECLQKATDNDSKDILAYLIHAAVLFFVARDQQAFARVSQHPLYRELTQSKPIRQLPTQTQLVAVLGSLNAPADVTELALVFSDQALGVPNFKAFRDHTVQHGIPTLAADQQASLCREALQGWDRLRSNVTVG